MRRLPIAMAALVLLAGCKQPAGGPTRLRLFCGAGIREPVADLIDRFEAAHDARIEPDYGGSNILLTRIKEGGRGDLYIPGDREYVRQAEAQGLIESAVDACYFVPVILVEKGNHKGIESVADFARDDVRIGLGNPEACAIGKKSAAIIEKAGITDEDIEPNVVFHSLTVNELGVQIQTGKIDACIVWDAIARSFADAGDMVEIPVGENVISTVQVAVLKTAAQPELAREFQQFAVSDAGRDVFAQHEYTVDPPE